MKLPAYPKYKPSGVEWLGEVPEHWGLEKLKYVADTSTSGVWGEDPVDDDKGYPVATTANISRMGEIDVAGMSRRVLSGVERKKGRCVAGDTVVVKSSGSATNVISGKAGYVLPEHGEIYFSNFTMRVRPRKEKSDPRFAWYFLSSEVVQSQVRLMVSTTTYPNLQVPEYLSFLYPNARRDEQRAIAEFLDHETGKLDALVAKKRTLVERLKEKRTALISRTVTRGLPPDAARAAGLDPHPKLKPSGIDWLGDVPAHWAVKRLKFEMLKIEQGWSPQCENFPAGDDDWGVLKAGAVNGTEFDPMENKRLPENEVPLPEFEIKAGDFLVSRANTRELLGSAGVVRSVRPRLLLCDKLYRLSLKTGSLNPEYLLRFMRSRPGRFEYERDASGSSASMQNIGQESVRNLWIPQPPLCEQEAIVRYLDAESRRIDAMVTKVESVIDRLQEYRTALITAAVTGKIDVRQRAAKEARA